jgi:hypothetical protein
LRHDLKLSDEVFIGYLGKKETFEVMVEFLSYYSAGIPLYIVFS